MKRGLFCFLWFSACLLGAVLFWAATADPATAEDTPINPDETDEQRLWDTDNLLFGGYSARSFAIPHLTTANRGPSGSTDRACGVGVVDGFFQNDGDVRNDMPVLERVAGSWTLSGGHSCTGFVVAQERAVGEVVSNGGFWLDASGTLKQGGLKGHSTAARGGWSPTYNVSYVANWAAKGSNYSRGNCQRSLLGLSCPVYVSAVGIDDGYLARVDFYSQNSSNRNGRSVTAPPQGLTLPTNPVRQGDFSTSRSESQRAIIWNNIAYNSSYHLSQTQGVGSDSNSGAWCPAGFHPRGEDAVLKIGRGTGRTLTSLSSEANVRLADMLWCRSDVRYAIRYTPVPVVGTTCGSSGALVCPSGVTIPTKVFVAWGRANCYYTIQTHTNGICDYPHPLPQCDPDPDNGSDSDWRALTTAEITAKNIAVGSAFNVAPGDDCAASTPATPPQQAGFTDDPCVTATIAVYENRPAGSDASPGVLVADRTLAVSASRPAHNLSVTSPHPHTASPPRDQTTGTGDPTGCADGSENRSDHTTASAGTARKQNPAPAFTASTRTDTSVPPNDADGEISYGRH